MRIINFIRFRLRKWLLEEITLKDYIKAGLKLGKNVSIQPGVVFDISHVWLIDVGDNVVIAPQAYILAHDTSSKKICGYTRFGKVKIENNVFIGARAMVLPNVTIGENSIIAACSVVTKSIPPNVVAAGNPAKVICTLDEYKSKVMLDFEKSPHFDRSYTINNVTELMKDEMNQSIINNGYIL